MSLQFLRACKLIVSTAGGDGLDLSALHVKFSIRKMDVQTPNTAEIRVYNVAETTVARVRKEFSRVIIQAGYESNFGVVFDGNIKQVRVGRENGTDTYIDIAAGDGDDAYNFAVVSATLAAGASQADQIDAASAPMEARGVRHGHIGEISAAKLPRGKVMYGMSRDYLRQSAEATDTSWSIQDGKLQFIPLTGVLPGQAVVLSSQSGLIGRPEQQIDGIKARCLLNPLLRIGAKVQIAERDIEQAKISTGRLVGTSVDSTLNRPASIAADGIYRLLVVEHTGDTRGNDWYSDIICLDVDATAPAWLQVRRNG